jgi:hypothetical protein
MPTLPSCPESDDTVIARTRNWLETAVIGLNLCPFAKAVHVREQIGYRVSTACSTAELADELRDALKALAAADPAKLDTILLIHPGVLGDFHDYNAFLAQADRIIHKLRLAGELQVASFHPDYQFADTAADDVDNATNRFALPHVAPAARKQHRTGGGQLSGSRTHLRTQRRQPAQAGVDGLADPGAVLGAEVDGLTARPRHPATGAWRRDPVPVSGAHSWDNLSPAAVDKFGDTTGTIEKRPFGANT